MRGSLLMRAHFMDDGRHAAACDLPCGFRAGETATDNMNGRKSFSHKCHEAVVREIMMQVNRSNDLLPARLGRQ